MPDNFPTFASTAQAEGADRTPRRHMAKEGPFSAVKALLCIYTCVLIVMYVYIFMCLRRIYICVYMCARRHMAKEGPISAVKAYLYIYTCVLIVMYMYMYVSLSYIHTCIFLSSSSYGQGGSFLAVEALLHTYIYASSSSYLYISVSLSHCICIYMCLLRIYIRVYICPRRHMAKEGPILAVEALLHMYIYICLCRHVCIYKCFRGIVFVYMCLCPKQVRAYLHVLVVIWPKRVLFWL